MHSPPHANACTVGWGGVVALDCHWPASRAHLPHRPHAACVLHAAPEPPPHVELLRSPHSLAAKHPQLYRGHSLLQPQAPVRSWCPSLLTPASQTLLHGRPGCHGRKQHHITIPPKPQPSNAHRLSPTVTWSKSTACSCIRLAARCALLLKLYSSSSCVHALRTLRPASSDTSFSACFALPPSLEACRFSCSVGDDEDEVVASPLPPPARAGLTRRLPAAPEPTSCHLAREPFNELRMCPCTEHWNVCATDAELAGDRV
jgi:hypothetical protein